MASLETVQECLEQLLEKERVIHVTAEENPIEVANRRGHRIVVEFLLGGIFVASVITACVVLFE